MTARLVWASYHAIKPLVREPLAVCISEENANEPATTGSYSRCPDAIILITCQDFEIECSEMKCFLPGKVRFITRLTEQRKTDAQAKKRKAGAGTAF